MSVKERVKIFSESQNISISAFEKSIGASNGYVNSISKSIGIDKLIRILEVYSNLNLEWLLTGKGEMLKISNPIIIEKDSDQNILIQQIEDLKRDKEELRREKQILYELLQSKLGKLNAS